MGLPSAPKHNMHVNDKEYHCRHDSIPLTAPSQSPVPVGFTPDLNPRGGANAAIWSAEGLLTAALFVGTGATVAAFVDEATGGVGAFEVTTGTATFD